MRMAFFKKESNPTSNYSIGTVCNEGKKLVLDKKVKIFKNNNRYSLYAFKTIITDCFDMENNNSLFDNLQIEKLNSSNKNCHKISEVRN